MANNDFNEMEKNITKSFEHATVAVDVALFSIIDNKLNVLLVEMDRPEFPGKWAMPGGLVVKGESLDASAMRHLVDRGGEGDVYIEQLASFGDVDRDPTGWVVSVAYLALTTAEGFKPKKNVRYKSVAWKPVTDLPDLAYDHKKILEVALERLRSKLGYSNIVFALMPHKFTLTELQTTYEIVLSKSIDKRNFRKKMLALDILNEEKDVRAEGAHRPAKLFSFKERILKITQNL